MACVCRTSRAENATPTVAFSLSVESSHSIYLSPMPLSEGIQDYLESIENYIYVSVSSAKVEMPNIQEAVNRLWADVSRFGPAMPEIRLPVAVEVPPSPPPPPPPPPGSLLDDMADWTTDNPWKASTLSVGVVGLGLLVGYHVYRTRAQSRLQKRNHTATHERRQVVGTYWPKFCVIHFMIHHRFISRARGRQSGSASLNPRPREKRVYHHRKCRYPRGRGRARTCREGLRQGARS